MTEHGGKKTKNDGKWKKIMENDGKETDYCLPA